jgi:2-oxoglutarate dehydrogenase E1 component
MSASVNLPNQSNLGFVESLYAQYCGDPASVPEEWRGYFESLGDGGGNGRPAGAQMRLGPSFRPRSIFNPAGAPCAQVEQQLVQCQLNVLQDRVDQLIRAYRNSGHLLAQIDPLGRPRPCPPELELEYYGFTEEDLDREFSTQTMHIAGGQATLRAIHQRLRNTYCRSIGVQYMHIDDIAVRRWLRDRMGATENRIDLMFEEFIRKTFVGAKSFSLEGCESLIPLLDLTIEKAGAQGIRDIVMGMAHRGRLNVLANIMGKSPSQIFREFADKDPDLYVGGGDVKYHLGHSTDWQTAGGAMVHVSLCFNPSHLEFVNPVVLGRIRAKQDRIGDAKRDQVMALLIHGDAAFAGEGIVQETLNMSDLAGYRVGGTLHVVVNNQIGFTTGPEEGRSSVYATDAAKMLQIPLFHVNGEDPEAVAQVVHVAMEFRREFKRDVVIDMYGYRRLGHNEGDEPSFTQPGLYAAIQKRKPVREGYLEHLLKLKGVTQEEADQIAQDRRRFLEKALSEAQREDYKKPNAPLGGYWAPYQGGLDQHHEQVETGVEKKRLGQWLETLSRLPDGFVPHPKIKRLLQNRQEMVQGKRPVDWATAEALAFGSVACEGYRIRLSGQDSGRGTFSQRHAILYDYERGLENCYVPLQHLCPDQAPVEIINSPLCETGVLGFDYGYSLDCPSGLIMWEAQFGDFWNVAQVIVDQFIASAEDKWGRLSGLVMLLPHGFEGQGPEHSSARLERVLSLSAEDNIQVVSPSTPAQYFHVLRRQVLRRWRKPLIVMTPKGLLRHPRVVSDLDELAQNSFEHVLPDGPGRSPDQVKRILLCTGRIHYELDEYREKNQRQDVAIVRLEQLYPLHKERLRTVLEPYPPGTPVFWVQEEPENMGAWRYLVVQFGPQFFHQFPFGGIYRPASASPATGSMSCHRQEQALLLEESFGD